MLRNEKHHAYLHPYLGRAKLSDQNMFSPSKVSNASNNVGQSAK